MIIYPPKRVVNCTLGGKALGLLKLLQVKNVLVPDFLMIPAENFDKIIDESGDDVLKIRKSIERFQLLKPDIDRIKNIINEWQKTNEYVIVRSSIADEDGKQDAFAGIMESYSGLKNIEDILDAVNKCALSAFSDKALAYRKQKQITSVIRPAIIIQKQITAEVSGVAFSIYPTYPFVMAVNAVWGMGEGLVNGDLDADEFYVDKSSGKLDYENIVLKEKQVSGNENEQHFTDVPKPKQLTSCVNPDQLSHLFEIVTKLELSFAQPLDVEFLIADGQLYIVQARPITQIIPQQTVYDNSNIQESFCGVTTELTFSFAQRAYSTVYRQTMQILSLSKETLETYEPVINNLLGMVKGRIYYNINNWYKGLQLLPSFKQNKEDMERMMGLEEPVAFVIDTEKSTFSKIKAIPSLVINLLKLLTAFAKRKQKIKVFLADFDVAYQDFHQRLPSCQTAEDIIKTKEWLDKNLLENWTTPIINDFFLMMMNGRVRRKLNKLGITEADTFLSEYFAGNQDVASAKQAFDLQKIAAEALKNKQLTALLIDNVENIHRKVSENFPIFYKEVENYIEIYGDRTVGELKLETVTMRLFPAIFYSYLRNYLINPSVLKQQLSSGLQQKAKKELNEKLKHKNFLNKKHAIKQLEKLQEGIQNREVMRLQRTRLFGMYRSLYLVGAELLVKTKVLNSAREVFYLTENELIDAVKNPKSTLLNLVENRKETFEENKKQEVGSRVFFPEAPYKKSEALNDGDLQGTGCVAGKVEAEIIVINSPEDDLNVNGKIICALRTDPGWVALFPTCKGVLIEKGSPLSHSVILLREFGIPTIINIKGLTKRLSSGVAISMDGTTGTIITKIDD